MAGCVVQWLDAWLVERLDCDVADCKAGCMVGGEVGRIDILLARCQAGWEVRCMDECWLGGDVASDFALF